MAKLLDLDEMLEVLVRLKHPAATAFTKLAEAMGTEMARNIAEQLDLSYGDAEFQFGFGGTCAALGPKRPDQPIPEVMEDLDPGADWELAIEEARG